MTPYLNSGFTKKTLFPLACSPFRIIQYLKIIPEDINTVSNNKVFLCFTPSWGDKPKICRYNHVCSLECNTASV